MLKIKLDKYNREARLYPTIIILLPIILFVVILTGSLLNIYFAALSGTVVFLAIVYVCADVVRNVGKIIEKIFFDQELLFPTTEFLLHKNNKFSKFKKHTIYEKIKKDCSISLFTIDEEEKDEKEARKMISEAVGVIRQKLRKSPILLQYNIRYGFWRNLVSMSLFSFFLSLCCLAIAYFTLENNFLAMVELILFVLYLLLWIFRKEIFIFFGNQYAEQFFLDYLNDKEGGE